MLYFLICIVGLIIFSWLISLIFPNTKVNRGSSSLEKIKEESWQFEFLGIGILNNTSENIINKLIEKGFTKTGDLTLDGAYCGFPCIVTIDVYNGSIQELTIEFKDPFNLTDYWKIKDAYGLKYEKMPGFSADYLFYTSYSNENNPIQFYSRESNKMILSNRYIYKQIKEDEKVALSQKYEL